jgi:hypothetical protein
MVASYLAKPCFRLAMVCEQAKSVFGERDTIVAAMAAARPIGKE